MKGESVELSEGDTIKIGSREFTFRHATRKPPKKKRPKPRHTLLSKARIPKPFRTKSAPETLGKRKRLSFPLLSPRWRRSWPWRRRRSSRTTLPRKSRRPLGPQSQRSKSFGGGKSSAKQNGSLRRQKIVVSEQRPLKKSLNVLPTRFKSKQSSPNKRTKCLANVINRFNVKTVFSSADTIDEQTALTVRREPQVILCPFKIILTRFLYRCKLLT